MSTAVALSGFTPAQIKIIKQTVAADTNGLEFDLFMEACRAYRLDPIRKQIHAIVYNKDKPDRRKMSIIVSRDGLRILAQRCGDYRPASEPAVIAYDEALRGPTNPKGIVSATVRLWKQDSRGDWYPVIGEAHWDEFAPVTDEWAYDETQGKRAPTGRKTLDYGNWSKMPVVMITKCAESQALRAGWPDQFGGVYAEEEMDRVTAATSASEELDRYEREERAARLGGPGLMLVLDDTGVLTKIPMGQVYDRCEEMIAEMDPMQAHAFAVRNAEALKEFWAHDKAAALSIKRIIEAKERQMIPMAGDAA
jgi:phage recombination protein Bet